MIARLTVPDIASEVVDVWFSPDLKALYKHLHATYGFTPRAPRDDEAAWVYRDKERQFVAVWVPYGSAVSAIGHECIHLAVRVMDAYGESPHKAEETFCLIWEKLFNQIYEILYQ